jgi:hypothetical protein
MKMDKKNTVGYRRELLMVLEGKIHSILEKETKTLHEKDVKQVIRGLIRIIAGHGKGNDWVVDTVIFNKSRLIRTWYYLSMDLSL